MRDYSDDFYQMNAGAHRRRATNFKAPALVWHRAFWIALPSSTDFRSELPIDELADARLLARAYCQNLIDDLILEVHQFLLNRDLDVVDTPGQPKCSIFPIVVDKLILFNRVVDCNLLTPVTRLSRREADVFESDNRVVTIKSNWYGVAITTRIEFHTEYFTFTTFAEIPIEKPNIDCQVIRDFDDLSKYLESDAAAQTTGEIDKIRKGLFHDFWENRMAHLCADAKLRPLLANRIFNAVFADFRGLIISDRLYQVPLNAQSEFGKETKRSWAKYLDARLMPLFIEIKRHECTASYMLDGRALYLTTLGPQLPEARDTDLSPLEYILYVHEYERHENGKIRPRDNDQQNGTLVVSKWQLGRLVDQIHLLGTVRLASLKYLPQLRVVGIELSELDPHVRRARDRSNGPASSDALRAAHQHFAALTEDFNNGTKTDTGILYRIERSRYYVQQFASNMQALRLGRVEGYQQYDQFVERRLGPVFDFINRLGVRYERAVNTLSLLDQYSVFVRTNEIDDEIYNIQIYGEVVLLAVLVPYYLSSLLDHVVAHDWLQTLTVGIWIVGGSVAGFRLAKSVKGGAIPLATGILFAGLGGLLITAILTGLYLGGVIRLAKAEPDSMTRSVLTDWAKTALPVPWLISSPVEEKPAMGQDQPSPEVDSSPAKRSSERKVPGTHDRRKKRRLHKSRHNQT